MREFSAGPGLTNARDSRARDKNPRRTGPFGKSSVINCASSEAAPGKKKESSASGRPDFQNALGPARFKKLQKFGDLGTDLHRCDLNAAMVELKCQLN